MAALAILHSREQAVHIQARLVFYGSEATHEVARAIVQEINRLYNEPQATVRVEGRPHRIFFVIEYALLPSEEAFRLIPGNTDFRNNFIRLEKENIITRSFMGFGLGENAGHWIVTDQLGISTTAAHEFGHSLGLDHPTRLDYRGDSAPPPIMAPRGTLVDPPYQWEPTARAGEVGGTMKPIYRRVSLEEIEQVVASLNFGPDGLAQVGRLSNIAFDATGYPVTMLA